MNKDDKRDEACNTFKQPLFLLIKAGVRGATSAQVRGGASAWSPFVSISRQDTIKSQIKPFSKILVVPESCSTKLC